MTDRYYLRCIDPSCAVVYPLRSKLYQCPRCQELLEVGGDFSSFEPSALRQLWRQRRLSNHPLDVSGVWRFRELLPFESSELSLVVTLAEGQTPLLEAPRSAAHAGLGRLRIKHLGWNPTGSFKDYGMTVAVTQARRLGSRVVACASTGNTSASLAAYCARADLRPVVFIPSGQIAYGKLSQSLDYGALTVQIQGDFDTAMQLVRELAEETELYMLNSINPFRLEGQKTIMFELMDQLDWQVPDRIVVPGGNLGNSSAFGKALMEMHQLGLIERIPRLTIVQAAGADPLHRTLQAGSTELLAVDQPHTLATAIKIGRPVSWRKARRALEFSEGCCNSVSEQEIADAKAMLGRDGIGCEPASATTVAGLRRLRYPDSGDDPGVAPLQADEDVVAILTGHQLKDPDYTIHYHLDQLYEEAEYQTTPLRQSGKLLARWANQPIAAPPDKQALIRLLELQPALPITAAR